MLLHYAFLWNIHKCRAAEISRKNNKGKVKLNEKFTTIVKEMEELETQITTEQWYL